ncbi:MAG: hypothetical protein OXG04_23995 [Acidobacteria bacterium]|nr:hypothetical protein [Acidobacteriota bacterium]
MAVRARLSAPQEVRTEWPWHSVRSASLKASLLFPSERRLEAGVYLGEGYATRLAIESKSSGWASLSTVARTWQPSRLKGIQIGREHGTAFLTATQVYDVRPTPRKWLSMERTHDHAKRFVSSGQILLTCSGNVGRATLAHETTKNILVSHDLLRIDAKDEDWWGWTYAYLRAPTVRKMMKSAQYGHIIKHLETHHLDSLPIVCVDARKRARFEAEAKEIVNLRDRAYELTLEAEEVFERTFGTFDTIDVGETGFTSRASGMFSRRRRLDAWHHNPSVKALGVHLERQAKGWSRIIELGFDVWLPTRFRRVAARDGVDFLDSSDLFEINPDITKRIADRDFGDSHNGRVAAGWILLARSGQIYGINGSAMLSGQRHEHKVISDHIIRIAPREPKCRPGYLLMAMSHPTLGRPRVKALPYGSSIPEIEVDDVESLTIPRLDEHVETDIADRVEEAARLRDRADQLETRLAASAEAEVQRFGGGV